MLQAKQNIITKVLAQIKQQDSISRFISNMILQSLLSTLIYSIDLNQINITFKSHLSNTNGEVVMKNLKLPFWLNHHCPICRNVKSLPVTLLFTLKPHQHCWWILKIFPSFLWLVVVLKSVSRAQYSTELIVSTIDYITKRVQ